MPRGNDPDAVQEFRDTHGITGNAEALIRAHRATQDPAVQQASLKQINAKATEELDLGEVEGQLEEGETLDSAVVRGNAIVAVVYDKEGRASKRVFPANDSYKAPAGASGQAVARAADQADAEMQAEVARLREERAQRLAEEAKKIDEEMNQELEKLREDAAKKVEEARKEAEEAEESESEEDKGKTAVTSVENDPGQGGGAKSKASRSTSQ
jgi:hypothetical protein